jgi:hypothetical protein
MTLRLNGATSGYTEIDAAATAGNNLVTLPTGTGAVPLIKLETEQASTSGTSVDFTDIPSWVKRITVMFNGVSTSGTSSILIQLGDSGGIENTGYLGSAAIAGLSTTSYTAGFGIESVGAAAAVRHGSLVLTNISANTWVASTAMSRSDFAYAMCGGGSKATSATLDRIRITTVNGTDTFDAGTINILYEG